MLVEAAIGDAYGSGFEFADRDVIKLYNNGKTYRDHPYWPNLKAGMYTDDTQMSIAVGETLLRRTYTGLAFANAFVRCFKRDIREGYSENFFKLLNKVESGQELMETIDSISVKCGSTMRSLPLGFLPLERITWVAEIQSKVTHNSSEAILCSQAVGLASYYMRTAGDPLTVRQFVRDTLKTKKFKSVWKKPVSANAVDVVCAVFTVLESSKSFQEALINSVNFSGDVDTVASLAAGLISTKYPNEDTALLGDLERSEFSLVYLRDLESQLETLTL